MFRKAQITEAFLNFDGAAKPEKMSATMNEVEFEDFYNANSRPLWAYARRIAGSAEIADDIVQESFMKFLGASLKSDANQKAYLYRIATNLVYDSFRRAARESKRQAQFVEEPVYEPFGEASEITKVFSHLKPQERALLWLAYVEGCQHDEVAARLGLKTLSVRVLLFRARRKLAALLDAEKTEARKL